MELLAPAGSAEALRAAVFCGADAVYLGGGRFNARQNAQNFTQTELAEAVSFCHARGVRVYVTLNTLQTDRELADGADFIRFVNRVGADALIVQDLGVARLANHIAPALPLHASTQMTVASAEGARLLAEHGFSRVVLARELSESQIGAVVRAGLPAEVFVHGALCVCFSGQCYYSALVGGRSGNRGLCAQPCRLLYRKAGAAAAPLFSLKDLSLGAHLTKLDKLGVASLKIEGRMRRPEYVAAACAAFRAALDEKRNLTGGELADLAAVFSRQGFTDGYFTNNKTAMQGVRGEIDEAALRPVLENLRKRYARERVFPKIGVAIEGVFAPGHPAVLSVSDGVHTVSVTGDAPEAAAGRGLTEEEIQARLTPGKGSPFYVKTARLSLAPGLFYAAAAGNALRRKAFSALNEAIFPRDRPEGAPPPPVSHAARAQTAFSVSVRTQAQLAAVLAQTPPARVYLPFTYEETWPRPSGTAFVLTLPRVFEPGMEREVLRKIEIAAKNGVSALLVGSLGTLAFAGAQAPAFSLYGDFGLNLTNSHALWQAGRLGLAGATASFELTRAQIAALSSPLPLEVLAYGRLPMMLLKRCLLSDCSAPNRACQREATLYDRRGEPLYLTREFGCQNQLWNGPVLWLADKLDDWSGIPLLRLTFTDESPARVTEVLQAYQKNRPCGPPAHFTRGLYYRGVQ